MVRKITTAPDITAVDVVVVEMIIDKNLFKPHILVHLLVIPITHEVGVRATNTIMIPKSIARNSQKSIPDTISAQTITIIMGSNITIYPTRMESIIINRKRNLNIMYIQEDNNKNKRFGSSGRYREQLLQL